MAMTLDHSNPPPVNADADFDMETENDNNDIDFDIDIEFETAHGDADVDVEDAPHDEDADEAHAPDEIMYEEILVANSDQADEVQMHEHHEADEEMDETEYFEVDNEDDSESALLQEYANPEYDIINDDAQHGYNHEEHVAGTNLDQSLPVDPLVASAVSSTGIDANDQASVATSVTLDIEVVEEPGSSGVVYEKEDDRGQEERRFQEEEEQEEEQVVNEDQAEQDEQVSLLEGEDWSSASRSYNTDAQPVGNHVDDDDNRQRHSFSEQQETHTRSGQPEHSHQSVAVTDTEAADEPCLDHTHDSLTTHDSLEKLVSEEANNDQHVEGEDEDSLDQHSSNAYNVNVHFQGQTLLLFPSTSDDKFEAHLLPDHSLANMPIIDLLIACKTQLADTVQDEQILGIDVVDLHFTILESDPDCTDITLSQIIDVYHHLHSNEESYDPEKLLINLTLRSNPMKRLNELFQAAEAGKGFTMVAPEAALHVDDVSSTDEELAGLEEIAPLILEENRNGVDTYDADSINDTSVLDIAAVESIHVNEDLVATNTITAAPEHKSPIGDPSNLDHATTGMTAIDQPVADDVGSFEGDDLIDYSDDEEDKNGDATHDNADQGGRLQKEEETSDEAITGTSFTEASQPKALFVGDNSNPNAENLPPFVNDNNDTTQVAVNEAASHANEDVFDDDIDFGFKADTEEDSNPQASSAIVGSPSAKRTFDEHAADADAEPAEQEAKRVRPDHP